MATDLIRYDLLVQDAFRDLFRKVLADAAANGLPGDHHFYITFRTGAPGVIVSKRLREEYPGDMTIILQHQFWDLLVEEKGFEVGLSFRQIPEKLVIPFTAVSAFFDPSVNFGAEFTVDEPLEQDPDHNTDNGNVQQIAPRRSTSAETNLAKKTAATSVPAASDSKSESSGAGADTAAADAKNGSPSAQPKPAAKKSDQAKSGSPAEKPSASENTEPDQEKDESPAKVISFDAFRKKHP